MQEGNRFQFPTEPRHPCRRGHEVHHRSRWSARTQALPLLWESAFDWGFPGGKDGYASSIRQVSGSLIEQARNRWIYPCSYTSNQPQTVTSGKVLIPGTTHRTVGTVECLHTRQVRLATTRWASQGTTGTAVIHTVAGARRRATGPAVLPDLSQFPTQLLTRHGPVVLDVVPELYHVSLDFQLVLLQPRDIEFLAGGTALKLTGDVLVVVSDDAKQISSLKMDRIWDIALPLTE